MCGIVGTIGGELYPLMTNAIKHRGNYIYTYNDDKTQCDFVHLPILDHLRGRQPFEYDGWLIWFNGEIYNYKELASKYDIPLFSYCDTEIIAKLFSKIGVLRAVEEFNGMFAIFAKRGDDMYLIRDRYGIKPLYYTYIGGKLYFSSEIKAFTKHPRFKTELDYGALREYLTYQNILTDRTLFKGVSILPPAYIYKVSGDGQGFHRYWKPTIRPEKMDFEEAKREVRRLLQQAVNRQLQSDVKIASFLSGGIDSNVIKSLAGNRVEHTFTAGYEDGYSEHKLSEINGAKNHHITMFSSESIKDYLSDTIYHLEDLRAGSSYTNYALYKSVKESGCTVVLQGTGGDELFSGYKHRYNMDADYRHIINRNQYYSDKHIDWDGDTLIKRQEFDLNHFLHGLLIIGDKLSMAHTLEDRVPFLDNDLVDFALKIPQSMKEDKWILKAACLDVLPSEIVNAPKWGFTSPEHIWFEKNKDWIKSELVNVWDVIEMPKHPMNYSMTWSMLSLEYWIRHYLL